MSALHPSEMHFPDSFSIEQNISKNNRKTILCYRFASAQELEVLLQIKGKEILVCDGLNMLNVDGDGSQAVL